MYVENNVNCRHDPVEPADEVKEKITCYARTVRTSAAVTNRNVRTRNEFAFRPRDVADRWLWRGAGLTPPGNRSAHPLEFETFVEPTLARYFSVQISTRESVFGTANESPVAVHCGSCGMGHKGRIVRAEQTYI